MARGLVDFSPWSLGLILGLYHHGQGTEWEACLPHKGQKGKRGGLESQHPLQGHDLTSSHYSLPLKGLGPSTGITG